VAQAVFKKQSFKRAEKELALTRRIDRCRLINGPTRNIADLLQIYDPPVMLYVRGDSQVLNLPSIGIWARGVRRFTGRRCRALGKE